MPLLWTGEGKDPIKVACKSCIDGHRSPTCFHLDRILVQVRQPGRPRVHCNHGKPSWGPDRCKQCYPTIAFVVPGHGRGDSKGCGCHRDKKQPIVNWQQTTEQVAETHERNRAVELDQKRAQRRVSMQQGGKKVSTALTQSQATQSSCCSSRPGADARLYKHSPSDSGSFDCKPATVDSVFENLPRPVPVQASSSANFHCGLNTTAATYLTQDMGSDSRQAVTPWIQGQHPFANDLSNIEECVCGDAPGECHCVGCSRHPNNKATIDYVNRLWDTNEQQMPETPMQEHQNPLSFPSSYPNQPFDFPVFDTDNKELVASPEALPVMNQQRPLPDFRVFTVMGRCPSCHCGPDCRCANCPCHASGSDPSSSSTQTSGDVIDSMSPSHGSFDASLCQRGRFRLEQMLADQPAADHLATSNLDFMDLMPVPQSNHGSTYLSGFEVSLHQQPGKEPTSNDYSLWPITQQPRFLNTSQAPIFQQIQRRLVSSSSNDVLMANDQSASAPCDLSTIHPQENQTQNAPVVSQNRSHSSVAPSHESLAVAECLSSPASSRDLESGDVLESALL